MIEPKDADFGGLRVPVYSANTVIVGTGAAGLNCAVRLYREMEQTGVERPAERVVLVTRGVGLGTSHNAGSDKQTYYKLGTHGSEPDTPVSFAETLTAGGCAHGDVALAEAENSLRAFYHLADIGVPFPHNAYGGFVGYKTDFDPRQRATSAGPWTSRYMVRRLLDEVRRLGIPVLDRHHVLSVIVDRSDGAPRACGLLCADLKRQDAPNHGLVLLNCRNVVMAGGGPGKLYRISVYPKGQMGPYAALFEAGATAHNLTESQFGLGSVAPRWNLSGTYQQVIPRYFSTDQDGGDVQEFLNPWFDSMARLATDVFLKGYQWPFDWDKVTDYGSSIIDILVQNETVNRGRRVFMDFRQNPVASHGLDEFRLEDLEGEALTYLQKSGAVQATPIERLAHMNQPSIDLYKQMGVDLWKKPLEVGVCSQHCNGGFAVDAWWESNVAHLFVVGELAGTHGVKRPGGSALNAGQVGAMRAAQRVAHVYHADPEQAGAFEAVARGAVARFAARAGEVKAADVGSQDCAELKERIQRRMSAYAGMVRSLEGVRKALAEAGEEWAALGQQGLRQDGQGYVDALEVRELALAQRGFLEAVRALLERGAGSRGSHLVVDTSGIRPHPELGDEWRFLPENPDLRGEILGVSYSPETDSFETTCTAPRPIPRKDYWFENTWAEFRRGGVFQKDPNESVRPYDAGR